MATLTVSQARAAVNAEIEKIMDNFNKNMQGQYGYSYDADVLKQFRETDDKIFAKKMSALDIAREDGKYSLTSEDIHKIARRLVNSNEKMPVDYRSRQICQNINSNIENVWNDVTSYFSVLRGEMDESELDKEITRDTIYDALLDTVQAEYAKHQDDIFIGDDKLSEVKDIVTEIMDDIDEFVAELEVFPESHEYAEGEEKEESLRDKIERLKASPSHPNVIKETPSRDEPDYSYSEYSEP